ncbi:MAG: tetratricopeptide repeat protein [Planctomycetota bacterium]
MRFALPFLALVPLLTLACASAGSQYDRGEAAYLREDYESALRFYQSAQRKDPEFEGIDEKIRITEIRLYMRRGDLAVEQADWDGAKRAYEEVLYRDPQNPDVQARLDGLTEARANHHYRVGQDLLAQENPFDAIGEFEEALNLVPGHERAAASLERARAEKADREERSAKAFTDGREAWSEGRHEEALTLLAQAVELDPRSIEARRTLESARHQMAEVLVAEADQLVADGRFDEAVDTYMQAREYDPEFLGLDERILRAQQEARAVVLVQEGDLAFEGGDWQAAFEAYDEAWYLTSNRAPFRERWETSREQYALLVYTSAQSAELNGDVLAALADLEVLTQIYGEYRDSRTMRRRMEERLDGARRAYEAGCRAQQERDLASAVEHFRSCNRALANFRDTAQRLRDVEHDIETAGELYHRASMAEIANETDRARSLYEECLAVSTPYRDAAKRLTRLQTADAGVEAALYQQARVAHTGRDLVQAREHYQGVQASQPDGYRDVDAQIADLDAQLEEAQGLRTQAAAAYAAGDLDRAEELYAACFAKCTSFEEVTDRLTTIEDARRALEHGQRLEGEKRLVAAQEEYANVLATFAKHADAKRRSDELGVTLQGIETEYTSMMDAHGAEQHRTALAHARAIRSRCRDYRDVDELLPWLESEVDYLEATEMQARSEHAAARVLFRRCADRTPGFRDAEERAKGL